MKTLYANYILFDMTSILSVWLKNHTAENTIVFSQVIFQIFVNNTLLSYMYYMPDISDRVIVIG